MASGQPVCSLLHIKIFFLSNFRIDFYEIFFISALYNDLDKLKGFIGAGQANKIDSVGYSSLHYAARNGHLSACELLLKAGADVNACTRSGNVTPLIRASMMGKLKLHFKHDLILISLFCVRRS